MNCEQFNPAIYNLCLLQLDQTAGLWLLEAFYHVGSCIDCEYRSIEYVFSLGDLSIIYPLSVAEEKLENGFLEYR